MSDIQAQLKHTHLQLEILQEICNLQTMLGDKEKLLPNWCLERRLKHAQYSTPIQVVLSKEIAETAARQQIAYLEQKLKNLKDPTP